MISTINAATVGGLPLGEYVALAARHGFTGVEFGIGAAAQLMQESSFAEVAAIFESHKVLPVVSGLSVEWRKDEDTFQAGLNELPALAKLSQDLDCTRWTTWVLPDGGVPLEEYRSNSKRRFIEISRVLADNGIRLGLEFIGPRHFRTAPENCWFYDIPTGLRAVQEISDEGQLENLGLLVDCFHWFNAENSVMDLASIPVEQIVHVHINDAPKVSLDEQHDHVRDLPGATGAIDIVGFLKTLAAIGYDGPVAAEVFSEELKALSTQERAARAAAATRNVLATAGVKPIELL